MAVVLIKVEYLIEKFISPPNKDKTAIVVFSNN